MDSSVSSVGAAPSRAPVFSKEEQEATLRKVGWRLLPLLFLCYVIAYVDRINVGFAKSGLQQALAVDPNTFDAVFGFGAGIFFIGYFIFEVPSNLILHRVGARIWIARIMIVWGFVSAAFMFLKSANGFYTMRFLLGAAEAGFFPGVLLYFTYWYPARERARIISIFAIGGVVAGIVGSPISGAIMKSSGLQGLGSLQNWQWLFILEAIPSVLLGFVVLALLPNNPRTTKWLSDREKDWIESRVASDRQAAQSAERQSLKQVFSCGAVYVFCLIYFLLNIGAYGFEMWAPTLIQQLSGGDMKLVGWLNAIPYSVAAITMFLVARSSDRTGERRLHIAGSALLGAIGFLIAAKAPNATLRMAGLVIAFASLKCAISPFWAMTTAFLSGAGAAGGIALINSVGNLGGQVGPWAVGKIKVHTHGSNMAALLFLGAALLGMAICALTVARSNQHRGDGEPSAK